VCVCGQCRVAQCPDVHLVLDLCRLSVDDVGRLDLLIEMRLIRRVRNLNQHTGREGRDLNQHDTEKKESDHRCEWQHPHLLLSSFVLCGVVWCCGSDSLSQFFDYGGDGGDDEDAQIQPAITTRRGGERGRVRRG
jgi:hypothetical protein